MQVLLPLMLLESFWGMFAGVGGVLLGFSRLAKAWGVCNAGALSVPTYTSFASLILLSLSHASYKSNNKPSLRPQPPAHKRPLPVAVSTYFLNFLLDCVSSLATTFWSWKAISVPCF